ncbi:DUF4037 domain-containing protein [Clostridium sp. D2Q-11]|uniref:DUF4037 domain-containing protein n=1 Tax=Anaeromonas frigoriresistens TaxID=2683708 RepID=A0A942Z7A1_9FIRM|nr:DUF4037 domain-containing protein [Anaeromonas frigoriresistens]MBS4537038.1 DUF4037 domain-containing protein [Anaeromonas frigoriresistens]
MNKKFIKRLELNEGYYKEVVKPLIEENYPGLKYSVGLIGYGSDVLGYDTHISMDHNWGPRMIIFLDEKDMDEYKNKVNQLLRKNLPYEYRDLPTNFTDPLEDGVQRMKEIQQGEVNHLIDIMSISDFLRNSLGIKDIDNIKITDWLKFSDQGLIEVTKGKVFHDGLDKLNRVRRYFEFYPEDVLRLKLAAFWNHIAEEEAFVGRNIDLGEDLGVKLIASRIVNTLMKICYLTEREYIPYSKWTYKGFRGLRCYEEISTTFSEILNCEDIEEVDGLICKAYEQIISLQDKLNITEKISLKADDYYGRPYKVVFVDKVAEMLVYSIKKEYLNDINLDYLSVIQNTDGIDLTDNKELIYILFRETMTTKQKE